MVHRSNLKGRCVVHKVRIVWRFIHGMWDSLLVIMRLWFNCNHIVHSKGPPFCPSGAYDPQGPQIEKAISDCLSPVPSTIYLFFPLPSLAAFLANILLNASLPLAPSGLAKAPGTITPLFGAMV